MRWAALIEGLPWYIGDAAALPSFAAGRARVGALLEAPQITSAVDPLGGIGSLGDVSLAVGDVSPEVPQGGVAWVQAMRWAPGGDYKTIGGDIAAGDTTIALDDVTGISAGDYLFAPHDTWRVDLVDSTAKTVTVTRGQYACTQTPIAHHYRAKKALDYTALLGYNAPLSLVGRWVALYRDGVLAYLGVVQEVSQRGPRWDLRTVSVLSLVKKWKLEWEAIPLVGNQSTGAWWVTDEWTYHIGIPVDDNSFDPGVHVTLAAQQGVPWGEFIAAMSAAVVSAATAEGRDDLNFSSRGVMRAGGSFSLDDYDRGNAWLVAIDSEPGASHTPSGDAHIAFSRSEHLPAWGVLLAVGGTLTTAEYSDLLRGLTHQIGDWLVSLDASGQIVAMYDDKLEPVDAAAYADRTQPHAVPRALYRAQSLGAALRAWLTATDGTGLGLPGDIIDGTDAGPGPVTVDFADGVPEDDLRAWGVAITWRDGGLSVRTVDAPAKAHAREAIRVVTAPIQWGRWAPTSELEYELIDGTIWRESVEYSVVPPGAARSKVRLAAHVKSEGDNLGYWAHRAASVLAWFSQYAPSVELDTPASLDVGDVVTVSVDLGAGRGNYGLVDVAGLVVERRWPWHYRVLLHPTTGDGVRWAPAWRITAQSGDDIIVTPAPGAALQAGDPIALYTGLQYAGGAAIDYVKAIDGDKVKIMQNVYAQVDNKYNYWLVEDESLRAIGPFTIAAVAFNEGNNTVKYPRIWCWGFWQDNSSWHAGVTAEMQLGYYNDALTMRTGWSDDTYTNTTVDNMTGDLFLANIISSDLTVSKHYVNGNWYIHIAPDNLTVKTQAPSGNYPPSFALSTYYQGSNQGAPMIRYYRVTIWRAELTEAELLAWRRGESPRAGQMIADWHWDDSATPYNLGVLPLELTPTSGTHIGGVDYTAGIYPHLTLSAWTTATAEQQAGYAFAAAADGTMSDGAAGKEWK